MSLNTLAWRGLQALAAVLAALASMVCFFFVFVAAIGRQVAIEEGLAQAQAFQGVSSIAFGLLLAALSSWLAWRILPLRGRVVFAGLLVLGAVVPRVFARSLNDPKATDVDFFILLAGAYALLALIMFVLVELGYLALRAGAKAHRGDRAT